MSLEFEFDAEAFDRLPPDKRRRAIAALKRLGVVASNNPLWRFDPLNPNGVGVPHLKQHRWMLAHTHQGRRVKRRLKLGGNRSGKTTSGDVADIIDLVEVDAVPPHLRQYKRWHQPIKMFLVAVNSRAVETIHIPKMQEWVPRDQLVGGNWKSAYSKDLMRLSFKNGSWLQFMTQQMDVEAFQGADLHRVHFDEEPLYDHGRRIYSQCLSRLIDHNGDMLITMTPEEGMTWLYDEMYEPWERMVEGADEGFVDMGKAGIWFVSVVDMDDNPTLDEEGKQAALAGYTEEERQAKKSGRFVSFSGKVYDRFDPNRHVVPDDVALEAAKGAPIRVAGIDPGFREQAGAVWLAQDSAGVVWVYGELARKETVISKVAEDIAFENVAHGLPPARYIADPAIERRDHQTGRSDREAYAAAGIPTALGNNDVRHGINRVKLLIEQDRLRVAASCEELLRQLARYRWKKAQRAENALPAAPVKRDDHLLDAFRYAVMSLPDPDPEKKPDTRTHHQRMVEEDIKRAVRGAPPPDLGLGPGFFT